MLPNTVLIAFLAVGELGFIALGFGIGTQMSIAAANGNSFRPNWENDPKFSQTLLEAYECGVEILVYKTKNTLNSIELVGECLKFNLLE